MWLRHHIVMKLAAVAAGVALVSGGGGCSPLGTRGSDHCPAHQHAEYHSHLTQDDTWNCVPDAGHHHSS
jgi:hypothetical protein